MRKRGSIVLLGTVLSFLFMSLPPSNGLSLPTLADKAGLPYPEDSEGTVFLRQGWVILDVQSQWASTDGYPPWHSVRINQTGIYVLENPGSQKTINVTFPMLTSHIQAGNGLVFQVDGTAMNYSAMRSVQVLDEDGLCCLKTIELYSLSVSIPAGGTTEISVQVPQSGATGRLAMYTFFMANASRWAAPVESFALSFHVAGGALTSSTIPSSANTSSAAIWNMANQTPAQDLAISWMITEPEPPLRPFSYYDPYPLIAAGLVAGIIGICVALLYFTKRWVPSSKNGPSEAPATTGSEFS